MKVQSIQTCKHLEIELIKSTDNFKTFDRATIKIPEQQATLKYTDKGF